MKKKVNKNNDAAQESKSIYIIWPLDSHDHSDLNDRLEEGGVTYNDEAVEEQVNVSLYLGSAENTIKLLREILAAIEVDGSDLTIKGCTVVVHNPAKWRRARV